jgi:predicted PurR-regulated permease PerM
MKGRTRHNVSEHQTNVKLSVRIDQFHHYLLNQLSVILRYLIVSRNKNISVFVDVILYYLVLFFFCRAPNTTLNGTMNVTPADPHQIMDEVIVTVHQMAH